jgi:hypothetical protein
MTLEDIIRYRLINQQLTKHNFTNPAEVISWLGAVQAQDYAGGKWAVAQRLDFFSDTDLDKAFDKGEILRTHLMRTTWHFVSPEDIRWILAITARRINTAINHKRRELKLDNTSFSRITSIFERELRKSNYLTRDELEAVVRKSNVVKKEIRFNYIMHRAEAEGIVCSGPRRGKQFTYALLEDRAPQSFNLSHDEALARLTKKYFTSHGPATIKDFLWWSGLTLRETKIGLESVKSKLLCEVIDSNEYWFASSLRTEKEKIPHVILLPNYDEYIVGYKDRSSIFYSKHFAKLGPRANPLFHNCLIIDGKISGIWRRTLKKDKVIIDLGCFEKLSSSQTDSIETAVELYGNFLEKQPVLSLKTIS